MCIETEEENSVFNTVLLISRSTYYTLSFTLLSVLGVGELVMSVPICDVYDLKTE